MTSVQLVAIALINLRNSAEIVMIACNTATTKCIRFLRQKYPDLISVGTEPAIKLTVDRGGREILLMATPNTATSEQVARLARQNITNQNLTVLACPGLADMVKQCVKAKKNHASFSARPRIIAKINNFFASVNDIEKNRYGSPRLHALCPISGDNAGYSSQCKFYRW